MAKQDVDRLQMELDFHGLIKILAENLYNSKDTFIRELIQNSHDACWRRHHRDPEFQIDQSKIDILPDLTGDPGKIVFRDNGEGMSREDVIKFLAAIGRSGTRAASEEAPEAIGQFGIGFLSGFVVGGRIEVRSRRFDLSAQQGVYWASDGDQAYDIATEKIEAVGTEVIVYLKGASERGHVTEEAVNKAVRRYADLLKTPIYVNDPHHSGTPANARTMPWERRDISGDEARLEHIIYLEKNVPDSVLEAIPINEPDIDGLLYITRTRVVAIDAPRTVRVFLKRMYLCDGATELLPNWATFVNGILNTTALKPNAARDSFMRDDSTSDLRGRLGRIIIAHLDRLKDENPKRLSEILAYHDLAIKAACHYHDEFFEKFFHLLEWRINPGSPLLDRNDASHRPVTLTRENAGWMRLPEIVSGLRSAQDDEGPVKLSYFASHASRSQFFQIANAAKSTVIDASHPFEEEVLRSWAMKKSGEVTLLAMGRHEDPNLFRALEDDDADIERLANLMSGYIRPGGETGRVSVSAKRIKPETVAAILRDEERTEGLRKAESTINDPNASAELKRMAEELVGLSTHQEMKLVINAASPLVRGVAELLQRERIRDRGVEISDDAYDLMRGLYNSALLANQRMMTATNAAIFHEQFQRLMERVLSAASELDQLRDDLALSRTEAEAARPQAAAAKRDHVQGFHVTPYAPEFEPVRIEMRNFFENELHCALIDARDEAHDRFINPNVRTHIVNADFFVIDLTGLNENVLMETGAIDFGRSTAPILLVGQPNVETGQVPLPRDLAGLNVHPYLPNADPSQWRETWRKACEADRAFKSLLKKAGRAQFVAPGLIREMCGMVKLSDETTKKISERFPTLTALVDSNVEGVESCLREDERLYATPVQQTLSREAQKRLREA